MARPDTRNPSTGIAIQVTPICRDSLLYPFVNRLIKSVKVLFNQILRHDPARELRPGLMLYIAQTILRRSEGVGLKAIPAFQEIVNDLYDGFPSLEERSGRVNPPGVEVPCTLGEIRKPRSETLHMAGVTRRNFKVRVVAAATTTALPQGADPMALFRKMPDVLKLLHDRNQSFGPLPVRNRNDILRDRSYIPVPQSLIAEATTA